MVNKTKTSCTDRSKISEHHLATKRTQQMTNLDRNDQWNVQTSDSWARCKGVERRWLVDDSWPSWQFLVAPNSEFPSLSHKHYANKALKVASVVLLIVESFKPKDIKTIIKLRYLLKLKLYDRLQIIFRALSSIRAEPKKQNIHFIQPIVDDGKIISCMLSSKRN